MLNALRPFHHSEHRTYLLFIDFKLESSFVGVVFATDHLSAGDVQLGTKPHNLLTD